jgi:trigger factor
MATKLIDKGDAIYEVTTSVDGKVWSDAQEKATKKLAENVEIKGFRKGKAPLDLAKERISKGQVYEEAMNIVLPQMFTDVVNEHKLQPFYRPDVLPTKVSDTELEVKFTIICVPEVTLGKYTGIKVPLEKVTVDQKEVDDEINHLKEENAEWIMKENEPAALGDTVVMDFKGYVDGKEFEGGSADNYSLVLGSNQFIPGFENQLVGAKPESKIDVEVTFPTQYVKELAGKKAKFVCMIHEVKTKKYPELNDEFAKGLKLNGVTDMKTLQAYEKAQVNDRKVADAKNKQFGAILDQITKNAKVTIADKVVDSEAAEVRKDMENQISQNGLSIDQYKEITGLTDDQLNEQYHTEAKNRLTQSLVLNKIAEAEKLVVSNDEIKDYYENIAKQYNMKVEDVVKALQPQEDRLKQQLIQGKIEHFIVANNSEEEAKPVEKTQPKSKKVVEDKKEAK